MKSASSIPKLEKMKPHEVFKDHSYRIIIEEQEIMEKLIQKYSNGESKGKISQLIQNFSRHEDHGEKMKKSEFGDKESQLGTVRSMSCFLNILSPPA